MTLEMGHAGKY